VSLPSLPISLITLVGILMLLSVAFASHAADLAIFHA
jgi:hypothetical protein